AQIIERLAQFLKVITIFFENAGPDFLVIVHRREPGLGYLRNGKELCRAGEHSGKCSDVWRSRWLSGKCVRSGVVDSDVKHPDRWHGFEVQCLLERGREL